jgi:hypothetical protein
MPGRRGQIIAWSVYALAVLALIALFVGTALFQERSVEYFNRNWDVVKRDGKTREVLRNPDEPRQHTVTLELNRLDYLNRRLDCLVKIERHEKLQIRMVNVLSWEWPHELGDEVGPMFDAYFVFPAEEEIYERLGKDVDHLERKFQLRVFGNPVWYPFDRYRADLSVVILNVPEGVVEAVTPSRPFYADSIRVTTLVQDSLPEFHMTARKHELSFPGTLAPEAGPNSFSFVLARNRFLQVFTGYIYAVALGVLIYLGFSRNPNELLGGAVGYFVSLWSVRSIIVGKMEVFPTIVDYATLLLFSLLVIVIIGRFMHIRFASQRA